MTTAEELYTGDAGAAYWKRNSARLEREATDRCFALRSLIPANEQWLNWLEIGCGRGHNLYSGDVGLDCDPRQLAYLPWKIITPILGHAYDLSMFPDTSFTVVLSVGCLMHLPGCDYRGEDHSHSLVACTSWQKAAEEMARVSNKYIILGEYVAEQEEPITGKHWEGCLWRRPYAVPGYQLVRTDQPLAPFDPDVTFMVFAK